MALKRLLAQSKLTAAKKSADDHRAARSELDVRRSALEEREATAEAAFGELTEESTPEERAAVEAEAAAIEAEIAALDTETAAHDAEQERLDGIVTGIETEIAEIDARTTEVGRPAETGRKEKRTMFNRKTKFYGMNVEERAAFFAQEEIRSFVGEVRKGVQNRAVSGATLTIPDIMLELLRDNMEQYSKLLRFVTKKSVGGTARQNIMGAVPEGVWMEAVGALNELDMALNQITVDGYMVGGFIPISNVYLEDSDIALGSEIMDQLGKAIGKGLDRAILFGTGTNMPIGIATRLAQTSQPASWGTNAPTWTDLHTTNVIKLNINSTTGATFYASLIAALGVAKPDYSDGSVFWVVNRKTHISLMTKALAFDAAAALVAGIKNEMPIIGGEIVELEMLGDNEIIGGFGSLYLLAERAGAKIESSEHVRFLQNQTVFKGYARYDGMPVFGEGFVFVSFDNTEVATTSTFPIDYANTALGILSVTAAAGGTTGKTVLTVTGTEASGTTLAFKLGDNEVKTGQKGTGYTALTSGTTQVACSAGEYITVIELDGSGRVIKSGKVVGVPKSA